MKTQMVCTVIQKYGWFLLLCIHLIVVLPAHAVARYQIVDLGIPPNFAGILVENGVHNARVVSVSATGINEQDIVTGSYRIEYDYVENNQIVHSVVTRGFIWEDGEFTDIGSLFNGPYTGSTKASDINDNGVVAGNSSLGRMEPQPNQVYYPVHAINWSGTMTDLGTGTEVFHDSDAMAVNNLGVTVGSTGIYNDYAARWENGLITRLPALQPVHKASAFGINENGLIVGISMDTVTGQTKAVLWEPGLAVQNLDPTPLNTQQSEAVDINNQGRIIGAINSGAGWLPVLWENNQLRNLFFSTPNGGARPANVNNSGTIVGSMRYSPTGRSYAFIWTDALFAPGFAQRYELESMLPINIGWELWSAADVNDQGYIVGSGILNSEARAFLMIPDDDPTADIDADSDRNNVIDDRDDVIELSRPGAVIAPNIDDSDGDGLFDSENDRIDGGGDIAQLSRLIANPPPTVAPGMIGEARLRVTNGPGKIRVFFNDGTGTMLLGPNQAQSDNFWTQLSAGPVELLAEGVEEGYLILELEVIINNNRHSDRITLQVPGFVLQLDADEPFLDTDGNVFEGGFFDVPADFAALDYQDKESTGVVNLYARLYREDELELPQVPPRRPIIWRVDAIGSQQVATQPGIRDLHQPQSDFHPQITAYTEAYVSRAQLRYSFPHPIEIDPVSSEARQWVKAGDEFKVTVTVQMPGGRTLTEEGSIRIVPGEKYFHITEPPSLVAGTLWQLSDAQFEQQFQNNSFTPPMKSGERKTFEVLWLDFYRNPLAENTPIELTLEGSGYLGMLDTTADSPDTESTTKVLVGSNGRSQITITQTTYANCPWQPEPELQYGVGVVGLFPTRSDPIGQSMVKRDESFPTVLEKVQLLALHSTITPGFLTPDIFQKQPREFEVSVSRGGSPLAGVSVQFTSLNGKLLNREISTDVNGRAKVTLTHEDARPDEEILVLASVGTESVVASEANMRWISTAPTVVKPEHSILAGDKTSDGMTYVETLNDLGESLVFSGAVENDDRLGVRYFAQSKVEVKGPPNHTYKVDIVDSYSWLLSARYPFDVLITQTTPDVKASRDATVSNAVVDISEKIEGNGSFEFNANGIVTVPGSPAVDLTNGLLIELWVHPAAGHHGTLLDRNGQYKLELIDSGPQQGHVLFSIDGVDSQGQPFHHSLISTQPLPPQQWSLVEVRYDRSSLRLGVGDSGDSLDTTFITFSAIQAVAVSTPIIVGNGYTGRLDDLRFTTGGHAQQIILGTGLSADGTITTDQNGTARFFLQSSGNWDPNEYRPAQILIELSGSPKASAQIQATHSSIIAEMINGGKAFLLGTESLGKDAHWFSQAMAWASENLPLLSDLRTLAMELYKAGSGCDAVSAMNVTFAAVGIVADALSFGTLGSVVNAMQNTLKVVGKAFLKEFAKNMAMAKLTQMAISEYMRQVTLQAESARTGTPPGWILRSHQFMTSLTNWAQQGFEQTLNEAIGSLENMLSWNVIYMELGDTYTKEMLDAAQTLGAELEAGVP